MAIEIGGDVGGYAHYVGYARTAPSHEVMERHNPDGDASLKRTPMDRDDGEPVVGSYVKGAVAVDKFAPTRTATVRAQPHRRAPCD